MKFQIKSHTLSYSKLTLPVLWQVLFVLSCFLLPESYYIYTNFFFYLGIIIFFYRLRYFDFKSLFSNLKNGKKFWIPVLWTVLAMTAAFFLSVYISTLFPNIDDGMINLKRDNYFKLIIFAISTIIFPPIAEETFYRKAFIRFDNKKILIISSILGMFMYALEHSLSLLGIIETMIIAVPLTVSYIKTKNVYVTMTAHFLVNLIGNGITVILTAIYLSQNI